MESLLNSTDILERTGLTLIHSLWQAGAIALVLLLFLKIIPSRKAVLRYNLGFAALVGFLMSILMTWSWLGLASESFSNPEGEKETLIRASDERQVGIQSEAMNTVSESVSSMQASNNPSILPQTRVVFKKWAVWITHSGPSEPY